MKKQILLKSTDLHEISQMHSAESQDSKKQVEDLAKEIAEMTVIMNQKD